MLDFASVNASSAKRIYVFIIIMYFFILGFNSSYKPSFAASTPPDSASSSTAPPSAAGLHLKMQQQSPTNGENKAIFSSSCPSSFFEKNMALVFHGKNRKIPHSSPPRPAFRSMTNLYHLKAFHKVGAWGK